LVDGLLKAGITPIPCLYHWDLPAKLQAEGGWFNRDSANWLTEYGLAAVHRLGDRVKQWFVLNEAPVHAIFGHGTGEHAPGIAGGDMGTLTALHHQNLAQGSTLKAIRSERPGLVLGTIMPLQPAVPETDSAADCKAAILWDAVWNRVALDGLMRGAVPEVLQDRMAKIVKPGDLDLIRQPIDVLGMNYYSRLTVRAAKDGPLFGVGWGKARAERFTGYDWPVQPEGLTEILLEMKRLYGNPAVMITENGAAYDDRLTASGVHDSDRIAFLADHLRALRQAIAAGCNVKGYMAWSLLDNFEWRMGYSKRFGLIYVDFEDLKRIPKSSFGWFGNVAKSDGLG
jgi:beta-glucosidase